MQEPQVNRRLTAILAADVVGFSAMMSANEAATLKALNTHKKKVFDPPVSRYNGRIVKLMGDGALVEFNSVVDAVKCARDIQISKPSEGGTPIRLRIGINLGDIIIQGDDIFGDGVNVASRLEQLAEAGGICISSVVHEIVAGRLDMTFRDGGTVNVKNIDRPLSVFHWKADEHSVAGQSAGKKTNQDISIAVLPFDNMSGDPEQEYFSDGISEDIITDLSKVSGLTVIARNSSFAYKGKAMDLRKVGSELGVTNILEGSVRRAGQRVRINAQLIEAASGKHIWADRYDRDMTDIFAVQDEVTMEIVNVLKIKLTRPERANIASVGTTNIEAHQDYMRMRGFLFYPGMNAEGWKEAVRYGESAIAKDPEYADAYGMLAMMHMLDFHNQWSGRPAAEAMKKADELSRRAVELGPDDIWSNHAAAVVALWQHDIDRAEMLIKRATDHCQEYSLGRFTFGEIELGRGRLDSAIENIERAARLDPSFRHQYLQYLAMAHFLKGHFETAALMLRERVFLVRDTDIGRAWLAAALGQLGEAEEARKIWAELMEIKPDFSINTRLKRVYLSDQAHRELVLEGLAKAGIPTDG